MQKPKNTLLSVLATLPSTIYCSCRNLLCGAKKLVHWCGTLKCENASIYEKAAKCEKNINAKCDNWQGRYVYRSEIMRQNKVRTYSVDFNTFRVEMFHLYN